MIGVAHAMAQTGEGAQGGGLLNILPFLLVFIIFYFLLIRPQSKRAKEHRAMLDSLKKNDRIITAGGIYGTIVALDDTTLTIEIAEKVRVKILRANIAALVGKQSESKDKAEKES